MLEEKKLAVTGETHVGGGEPSHDGGVEPSHVGGVNLAVTGKTHAGGVEASRYRRDTCWRSRT